MNENRSQNCVLPFALLLGALWAGPLHAEWQKRVPLIEAKLKESLTVYTKGDIKNAKRLCDDAYFEIFESLDANMEIAIRRSISLRRATELESQFGEIRKAFTQKTTSEKINEQISKLLSGLNESAKKLDADKVANVTGSST